MFGPNKSLSYMVNINYSHRDKSFIDIVKQLKDSFLSTFNLGDFDVLFIPGSGTTGIESVLFSILSKIKVIGNKGIFHDRWVNLTSIYNKNKESKSYENLFCQLETSNSKTFDKSGCIVDAVSSFPYCEIPDDTKIIITSSNKLLGSMPGCAIVFVRNDYWDNLTSDNNFSTLNLRRYKNFSEYNQIPMTPPTPILEHMLIIIQNYKIEKIREKIDNNSRKIVNAIGKENIIGDLKCPVITTLKSNIPIELADKYQLYHFNTTDDTYQIFTYSEKDEYYDEFYKEFVKKR